MVSSTGVFTPLKELLSFCSKALANCQVFDSCLVTGRTHLLRALHFKLSRLELFSTFYCLHYFALLTFVFLLILNSSDNKIPPGQIYRDISRISLKSLLYIHVFKNSTNFHLTLANLIHYRRSSY